MLKGKHGVYLIAEIGGNHEGSYEKALELLRDAAESGVDSIKFQIYSGETIVNKMEDPDRARHFSRFELTGEEYKALAKECRRLGVDYNASIWDITQIDAYNEDLTFYKIGSGDLTAYPLLKKTASTGKPIVLSTGLSTYDEIFASIDYICRCNSVYRNTDMITILQCTSMYPIPDSEANLAVIRKLKDMCDYRVGYSDHTEGTYAVEVAIALGAEVIEFHYTDSRENRSFRDHKVSFTRAEVEELVARIALIKALLGSEEKKPTRSELQNNHVNSFRRALYPVRKISSGETVGYDDFIALRPDNGVSAAYIEQLVGAIAKRDLGPLERIEMTDFELSAISG